MAQDETQVKTMWSASLLESFFKALKTDKSDDDLKEIILDLKAKGFTRNYLVNRAQKKLGKGAASRVIAIYSGGNPKAKVGGRRKPSKRKSKSPSFFDVLKSLFTR